MKELLIKRIIRRLKEDQEYKFGYYERIYPDDLNSKTKGHFKIVLDTYVDCITGEVIDHTFYACAEERMTFDYHLYQSKIQPEEADKVIQAKLTQFKYLKSLGNWIFNQEKGFLRPTDSRLFLFELIKEDLPDANSDTEKLEKFLGI